MVTCSLFTFDCLMLFCAVPRPYNMIHKLCTMIIHTDTNEKGRDIHHHFVVCCSCTQLNHFGASRGAESSSAGTINHILRLRDTKGETRLGGGAPQARNNTRCNSDLRELSKAVMQGITAQRSSSGEDQLTAGWLWPFCGRSLHCKLPLGGIMM